MIKQCTKFSTHLNILALLDYVPQLHRLRYELHLMPWIVWQVLVPSRDPLQVYKWVHCPMACILTFFWRSVLDFYLPPPQLSLGVWTSVEECKRRFSPLVASSTSTFLVIGLLCHCFFFCVLVQSQAWSPSSTTHYNHTWVPGNWCTSQETCPT